MKKLFTKIKLGLATLWIALISFFSKVTWGLSKWPTEPKFWDMYNGQEILYWVPRDSEIPKLPKTPILLATITKIIPRILITITFIIWIINFIKIRKINDENLKKKKIKNTIIIISILIILIIATFLIWQNWTKNIHFIFDKISNLLSFFEFI